MGWREFPACFQAGECAEFHHGGLLRLYRHECSGNMYLLKGDHFPVELFLFSAGITSLGKRLKWADKCAVEQLLVVYYQRQQYQQRMEREYEQWQREQQQ